MLLGIYEKEFSNCANENAYCTPYTLLRLLADLVPNMPDKLLYLDIDMMANGDISDLYNTDITEYEYAAVKEKYGSVFIWPDYINAGVLLLNMKKIKEVHNILKCYTFDDDLEEYIKLKEEYEVRKGEK